MASVDTFSEIRTDGTPYPLYPAAVGEEEKRHTRHFPWHEKLCGFCICMKDNTLSTRQTFRNNPFVFQTVLKQALVSTIFL